jgi:uncharacterized protein (TIGR00255 family)
MIKGMTGFGASNVAAGKVKAVVEIKTVNHRYLDLAFYLPSGFSSFEERIQKIVAKHIRRGRVTIAVKITEKPNLTIALNEEAVTRYRNFGKTLAKRFQIKDDLSVADIMRLPGVVEVKEVFVDAQTLWPAAEKGLVKALRSVVDMRRREGKSLEGDINGQLVRMLKRISQIKARANALLKAKKASSSNEEFSAYQKSNDINEELARLAHHIDEAKALLKDDQEAGKKLDFIAQEMQRETNTIGSKVQDKEISAAVIALKGKVEKIREQANNVE